MKRIVRLLAGLLCLTLIFFPGTPGAVATAVGVAGQRAVFPAGPFSTAPTCWVRLNDGPAEYNAVQEAVDASTHPTDVVKVAGYCPGVGTRHGLTQTVYLSKTLTLQGGYTLTDWTVPDPIAHPTTLDALGQGRVLYVGAAGPTIAGVRLTGGNAVAGGGNTGGGVYIATAAVALSRCTVISNSADYGGGVYMASGAAVFTDNTVVSNTAEYIGGGLRLAGGVATLTGNTVAANTAGTGGGIYVSSEAATLTANLITANRAWGDGGGVIVEIYGAKGTLNANTITANWAGRCGGGLYFGEAVRAGREERVAHARTPAGPPRILSGNWIAGNVAVLHGGGVFLSGDGGSPFLDGNTVVSNTAGADGGGVYLDWSSEPTTISDNTIAFNVAEGAGGGVYLGAKLATVRGNNVAGNRSKQDGGGVYGDGTLSENSISGNTAGGRGGGVYGSGVLSGNSIRANSAASGGGLYLGDGVLTNTLVADNRAQTVGSGLYLYGSARLLHTTIARNGGGDGSGVYIAGEGPAGSSVALTNTVLVGHTAGLTVTAGSTATLAATLWGNAVDWGGAGHLLTGTANFWGDPAFVDPAGGDYHLGSSSAAIDRGVDAGVTSDIDGGLRPAGRGFDLGADEFPGYILLLGFAQPVVLNPAQVFSAALEVRGTGILSCTQVLVGAALPVQQQALAVAADGGACAIQAGWGGGVACELGPLPPGGAVHITLTAQVTATLPPTLPLRMHSSAWVTATETASRAAADSYLQDCHARLNDSAAEYTTVQEAVDASTAPTDVVKVAGFCVGAGQRGGLRQQVYLSRTLTVQGGYTTTDWTNPDPVGHPTTLDALGQGRVLYLAGSGATVAGLRMTGGDATGLGGFTDAWGQEGDAGGGVWVAAGTIRSCTVAGNAAEYGGGLYVVGDDAVLLANTVASNTARMGGGMYLRDSAAALSGNAVIANAARYLGGGLLLERSPATLAANAVLSNRAVAGAGLALVESPATLAGNTIAANAANSQGGGIYLESGAATIHANTIATNTAQYGGGLYLFDSHAWLDGNAVFSNTARADGGGLYLYGSPITVTANTFLVNVAGRDGGGLYVQAGPAGLVNNVIADNRAVNRGSGLYEVNSRLWLWHNTIAGNRGGTAGLYITHSGLNGSTVALTNTILVSHSVGIRVTGGDVVVLDAVLWYSTPLTISAAAGAGVTVRNAYTGDPAFLGAGHGDYHIGPTSAAVDRGIDAGIVMDIDGQPRPYGEGYDLGADELWLRPASPVLLSPPDGAVTTTAALTFTWQAGPGALPGGYHLQIDGLIIIITTTGTTWRTVLAPGIHVWTVRAYNAAGPSPWAAAWSVQVERRCTFYLPLVVRERVP